MSKNVTPASRAAATTSTHGHATPQGTPTDDHAGTQSADANDHTPRAGAEAQAPGLARAMRRLGAANVVITGGHRAVGSDLFYDGATFTELDGARHPGGATHGSGCTHSAVLAAQLALGATPLEAARTARAIAAEAIGAGLRGLGGGEGPVDVLGAWRRGGGPTPCRLP